MLNKRTKEKLVSIVIVNYNGKDNTLEFLQSLKKTDYPNYEIIVVDNASTDSSIKDIKKRFPKVKIVKNKENLGYGCGLNSGIKHSKGDYIVTLVNDMFAPQKSWLSELVKVAESDKKIGMVTSLWFYYDNSDMMQREPLKLGRVSEKILELFGSEFFGFGYVRSPDNLPDILDIKYGNGLIKREALEKIGLFDKDMFLNYEQNDFGYRLRKAGYRIVLATESRMYHKGQASINKESDYFVRYHFYKGKIRFMLKNYNPTTKVFAIASTFPYYIALMVKHTLTNRPDLARALRDAIVWNIKKSEGM